MRAGRYAPIAGPLEAELAGWRGPITFYFASELASVPVGVALRDEAEAIYAGQRQILGLGWMTLPSPPWHLEPKTGIRWPEIDAVRVVSNAPPHLDPRLTWEFNRGHEWVVLARVFAATGETRFLERLEAELVSWRTSNPIGLGINWVSAMEVAIRIHSLAWVAGFLRAKRPESLGTIAVLIYEHAVFVANHLSYFSSANNHLIVELSGLIVAARALGGVGALNGLHHRAISRLDLEATRQIFDDGVNAEMATHYHLFVMEALLLVAHLERAHGEPCLALEGAIAKMSDYVAALSCADGRVLEQGDNDNGRIVPWFATNHATQLIAAATTRRDPGLGTARPSEGGEGVFWITNGGVPSAAVRFSGSRRFVASGQIVLRSDRLVVSFDAGSFGFGSLAAHAHCDCLSINLALDGSRFLVDRGTYRYNGDRSERDEFRMTAAHNTVQVGTREQADAVGPFLWSRRPTVTVERCELGIKGDVVVASHDGFAPARHRRTLVHFAGFLLVLDHVVGAGSEVITRRFHLAPELRVATRSTASGTLFAATTHGGPAGWIWTTERSSRVIETRHSDTYASVSSSLTIEERASGHRFACVIGPSTMEASADAIVRLAAVAAACGAVPDAAYLLEPIMPGT